MHEFTDLLTERDLKTLADVAGTDLDGLMSLLRSKPWRLWELLADEQVRSSVLERSDHPAQAVSPGLLFGVLVVATAEELRDATYVHDWTGPTSRLPVFDVEPLQEFVADLARVTFLVRLLSSFATPTPPPVPARPFDFRSLVAWLEQVEAADREILLRRLGDLALFMTGVFPDRTGVTPLRPVDAERLGKSVGMAAGDMLALCDPASPSPGLDAFEELGRRWYAATSAGGSIVQDVANRFRAARRVLNHLTDRHLYQLDLTWPMAG